jgi:hypothetical protein
MYPPDEEISYVPHVRHRHNCSVIGQAKEGKPFEILIVPENDQRNVVARITRAVLRGDDLTIRMPDGVDSSLPYQDLLARMEREKPGS